jgi:hypothetical protein
MDYHLMAYPLLWLAVPLLSIAVGLVLRQVAKYRAFLLDKTIINERHAQHLSRLLAARLHPE